MRTFFLAWQNEMSRKWFPVGRLRIDEDRHVFEYIRGVKNALAAGFQPLVCFPDLLKPYESTNWFPVFESRIMPSTRPDFKEFVRRLDLDPETAEPIQILARSGGGSSTDALEVFEPPVAVSDGRYRTLFFTKGLSHMHAGCDDVARNLKPGDRLRLAWEYQNPVDPCALLILASRSLPVGWVPTYLAGDFLRDVVAGDARSAVPPDATVIVERVNPDPDPIQQRVFCRFEGEWSSPPFSSEDYQTLSAEAI